MTDFIYKFVLSIYFKIYLIFFLDKKALNVKVLNHKCKNSFSIINLKKYLNNNLKTLAKIYKLFQDKGFAISIEEETKYLPFLAN